jgi:hypothetical protein
MIIFFGVNGIALLDVLPTVAKLTTTYLCYNIIEALEQVVYSNGRVPGTTHYALHFDNAPVQQAQKSSTKTP